MSAPPREQALEMARQMLRGIDRVLIGQIAARLRTVRAIAEHKNALGRAAYDPRQQRRTLLDWMQEAEHHQGLDPQVVAAFYELMHELAVEEQVKHSLIPRGEGPAPPT